MRSPWLSISILLFAASQVILLPAESVMTIDLELSESSSRIVWPMRVLSIRCWTAPSPETASPPSGGASTPFHIEPMTMGRFGSPRSKTTSTSSSTSGTSWRPRSGPAIGLARRAQADSSESDSHGNLTLTLPSLSSSLTFVTMPMTGPSRRDSGLPPPDASSMSVPRRRPRTANRVS